MFLPEIQRELITLVDLILGYYQWGADWFIRLKVEMIGSSDFNFFVPINNL